MTLHAPQLEEVNTIVAEICAADARAWAQAAGICPDALADFAAVCGRQATASVIAFATPLEEAVGNAYTSGFMLGWLAHARLVSEVAA
jgi:hypothetical protein